MNFKNLKSPKEFSKSKKELIDKFQDFYDTYDKFIFSVSPSQWRTTGHHMANLREIGAELVDLDPLLMKDLESEFVRDQILTDEEKELWNNVKK